MEEEILEDAAAEPPKKIAAEAAALEVAFADDVPEKPIDPEAELLIVAKLVTFMTTVWVLVLPAESVAVNVQL